MRTQAKLVLRWFRDDPPMRPLALEARLPISTSYRYLHEAIDVIAEQAPDLHEVLEQAKREGWSHLTLDGTLIEIDRVNERTEAGHHLWYSGKHKTQGGNMQILADPGGFPVWSSEVEPGSVHDITAARAHCLGALYKAAADGVPTLTDKGYKGAGIGVHSPIKGRDLDVDNRSYNTLLTAVRAIGERANAELKERWRCLRRIDCAQTESARSSPPQSSYRLSNEETTEKTSVGLQVAIDEKPWRWQILATIASRRFPSWCGHGSEHGCGCPTSIPRRPAEAITRQVQLANSVDGSQYLEVNTPAALDR